MNENNDEQEAVYFRDRAKQLGLNDAYEPINTDLPHGIDNPYKYGDLAVWEYIIEHK